MLSYCHLTGEKIEAQEAEVNCPKSQFISYGSFFAW